MESCFCSASVDRFCRKSTRHVLCQSEAPRVLTGQSATAWDQPRPRHRYRTVLWPISGERARSMAWWWPQVCKRKLPKISPGCDCSISLDVHHTLLNVSPCLNKPLPCIRWGPDSHGKALLRGHMPAHCNVQVYTWPAEPSATAGDMHSPPRWLTRRRRGHVEHLLSLIITINSFPSILTIWYTVSLYLWSLGTA